MSDVETLLAVQDHDSALDRLAHRRRTLPERAELAAVEARLATLSREIAPATEQRDEVARLQSRLEDEVASIEAKVAEVNKRLYSGTVSAPRELQAMQADVISITRHKGTVEDHVLEAMERREPLEATLDALLASFTEADTEAERLREVIASAELDIDIEIEGEQALRDELAGTVPAEMLAQYDALRPKLGGVAVARLERGSCMGCHLSLSATELDRIKKQPADALVRCEQCSRILVR